MAADEALPFRTYMCLICGFIYDEAAGLPEEGIPAGTRWGRRASQLGVPRMRGAQGRL